MATKLKNIESSKAVKLTAAVLALVMFFCSGWFANLFIRGFANYNAYDRSGGLLYTQTSAFRGLMNRAEEFLIGNAMFEATQTFEEFKASEAGKAAAKDYDALAKKVSDAYDLLESSGIDVYVSNDNSYYYLLPYKTLVYPMNSVGDYVHSDTLLHYYDNGIIEHIRSGENAPEPTTVVETQLQNVEATTSHADYHGSPQMFQGETDVMYIDEDGKYYRFYYATGNTRPPLEVQDVANALSTINNVSGYTSYGESTKERLVDEILNGDKEEYLRRQWQDSMSYNHYDYIVKKIKNVNYAVVFENGKVVTNCGVLATDTEEQILEKLGGEFAEASIKGEYKLLKGEKPADSDNAWGGFADMLIGENVAIMSVGSYLFADPQSTSAYFSYVQRTDVVDPFTISYFAFSDFANSSVNNLTNLLILFGISFLIACAACIYLLCVTGKTADGVKINFFDRIPAAINWALGIGVMALLGAGVVFVTVCEAAPQQLAYSGFGGNDFVDSMLMIISPNTDLITAICVALFFGIWTALNASFIRNIRNKSFWKHTLCFNILRLVKWIFAVIGKAFGFIIKPAKKFFKKQVEKIKYILVCDYAKGEGKKFKIIALVATGGFIAATALYYLVAAAFIHFEEAVTLFMYVFGVIGDMAVVIFAALIVSSLDRIMEAVSAMRRGELNTKIDTRFMPGFMLRFAEDILSVQDGLQNAVESAVKDQRMKAELITNVSHDLKTPLTSIVNYVDLLKKCEVEDETAQRYITVLDEKAAKMKKLIEDLVEASKASSGAIEIHPVRINLTEFAAQAVGEHEDELNKIGIGIVLRASESFVNVTADSQKTSRIVENLFSNIRKYALEGTRVYVEVVNGDGFGSLVFKNISKNEIGVSADELTQRFVRGDASRSGEGSGLGLSIAQNLCELQGGRFRVEIDGDLFKVTVSLPKAE